VTGEALITPDEIRLLQEYAALGSMKAVAHLRGRSTHTIRNRLASVYHALGVESGVQAVYVVFGSVEWFQPAPPVSAPSNLRHVRHDNEPATRLRGERS
jgi:DNA-binding CsgD family transcriptional regulator